MQVFGVQPEVAWEDKRANFARVRALLESTSIPAGSLIVLPEMFATGFSMNVAGIHEGHAKPTEAFLAEVATNYKSTVVGGLVSLGLGGRGRNEAVVVSPTGEQIARYVKLHPFTFAGESEHFAAGDEVVVFDWQGVTVSPLICYDLRFAEAYRQAASRGAQLFLLLANFPAAREDHWLTLNAARAIENQAYVVAVNRCGADPNVTYGGRSQIIDPMGKVLSEAGDTQTVIHAELDLASQSRYRQRFPALHDLRKDMFDPAAG